MMTNNILFYTANEEVALNKAKELAKENKLEFFSFSFSRESVDIITELYRNTDNILVFIANINKSPVVCSLLKPLEDCKKNCWCVASAKNYDIPIALESRFKCIDISDDTCKEAVDRFLSGDKVSEKEFSSLEFYRKLAEEVTKQDFNSKTLLRLNLINNIIDDIMLSTNNILWPELYYTLRGGWSA